MTESAEILYSEMVASGIQLDRIEDGRLSIDDCPAVTRFIEDIKAQRDALLEIVARRDELFYQWVMECCLLSNRVSGNMGQLWLSYEAYCNFNRNMPNWPDFDRMLRREFPAIERGTVQGIALTVDWRGYEPRKAKGGHA